MARKSIMGEGDVLFYDNIFKGIKPSDYIKNRKELMSRREALIAMCVQCHSTRFSRNYLESMDKASDSIFQYVSDSYATIKSLKDNELSYLSTIFNTSVFGREFVMVFVFVRFKGRLI